MSIDRHIVASFPAESAQSHLAAIVASSDDAIVSKTLEGIIQTWNASAERIFGYTASEAVGQPILMLLPVDRRHEEAEILARLRRGERVDHFESVRITKDGRFIDVSLTISPIKNAAGEIIGASKVARDITRQKALERELQIAKASADSANRAKDRLLESERAARAEAEHASRMKDEFLANVSHELRTPLNAILGWSHILKRNPSADDVNEGVDIIERNARQQVQIIEDLLDMSRMLSGKMSLRLERLDVDVIVRQAVQSMKPTAQAKSIRLQTVHAGDVGPVSADANRLLQVLWNLISNAIKFTPSGGVVQIAQRRVDQQLEIRVSDTGEGIDPDFLPHVFDRFRQAEGGSARRHRGLGLGLSIVKQLVELHGGSVRADSGGKGRGAMFTVSLPLLAPKAATPPPDLSQSARDRTLYLSDAKNDLAGVEVVVVDDEADTRSLVKRVLEERQALVRTAGSALEALALVSSGQPHVLVSDIGMPDVDGYSLIKQVRKLAPTQGGRMPAIAMTAYARTEDRVRAVLAGFDQYLVKPVDPLELVTLVAVLSGRSQGG